MVQQLFNTSLLLFIFLLPLIPAQLNRGYEEIKVLTLLYGILIIGIFFASKLGFQKLKIVRHTLYFWAGLMLFILLITALTGINPQQSLLGAQPYFQGWITFAFLFLLSFFIFASTLTFKQISWALILSATAVSLVAIYQYLNLQLGMAVPTYAGRVVSTFGQPNFYAGFLLFCIPFLLALLTKPTKSELFILLASFALIMAAIAVSFSRTAIIITAIIFSFWLIKKLVKTKILKGILLIILTLGIIYALIPSRLLQDELIAPLTGKTVQLNNAQRRIYIWQAAIEEIKKRPLIGYGLENIAEVYPDNYDFNHPKPAI